MGLGCGAWDDVARQFTVPRYRALWRYWADHPPVPLMIAAYLGIKPTPSTPGDPQDLLTLFGAPGSPRP